MRSHTSVLLRRLSFKPYTTPTDPDATLWDMVQETTRAGVRELLLSALGNETDQGTRHKVADTIAEVAKSDLSKNGKKGYLYKEKWEWIGLSSWILFYLVSCD